MIDPSVLLGYSAMGLANQVIGPWVEHFFPTTRQRAQLENLRQSAQHMIDDIELRQNSLTLEREKFRESIFARNQDRQDRFELQKLASDAQFQHQRNLLFPLRGVLPNSIVQRSRDKFICEVDAAGKRVRWPLNVIVKYTGAHSNADIDEVFNRLNASPAHLFDDHLLVYADASQPFGIGGDNLIATLNKDLESEPCVLIEVSSVDRKAYHLDVAYWGWLDRAVQQPVARQRRITVQTTDTAFDAILEAAILGAICQTYDAFRLVTQISRPPSIAAFTYLRQLPNVALEVELAWRQRHTFNLHDVLLLNVHSTLEHIAVRAPLASAVCSAKLACDARAESLVDLSELFLSRSLTYLAMGTNIKADNEQGLLAQLQTLPAGHLPSWIETAIRTIHGIDLAPSQAAVSDREHRDRLMRLSKPSFDGLA